MRQAAITTGIVVVALLIVLGAFAAGIWAAPRILPARRYERKALRVYVQPAELHTKLTTGWEVERVDTAGDDFHMYVLRRRLP